MKASQFYCKDSSTSIPFDFISEATWLAQETSLSTPEINGLNTQQFKGAVGDVGVIFNAEGLAKKYVLGSGAGQEAKAMAIAVNKLPAGIFHSVHPLLPAAQLAWSLAQYRFDEYKTNQQPLRRLVMHEDRLLDEANAVFLVRDLINQPANQMNPEAMAVVLERLAQETGAEFTQWIGEELIAARFPAIYAVGQAAAFQPRLLSLTWGNPNHPKITLVGKGVCFDSGGLDIKPSSAMRLMKKDMGGAAQVIGLAQWLMAMQLPIRLQVFIPAVENAINGNAYRPGDVLTMRSGLTVEIDNTDAEGRLILADALVKACEDNPELLIDFSTLTGAARVAVGTEISALFSPNDDIANELMQCGTAIEDPIWRLPLFSGYASQLDSSIADLSNSSPSPYAGAIVAGLFLQHFVSNTVPWVHFDVMAWNVSSKPGKPEGGEAMGMRAVGHYLRKRYGTASG